ncbi:alpha-soluble NSF attachment protein [Strigomonas culicis]|nr:alpha-soluble NSF attachment protein [Strigomonas culicis]|eukprot:EPY33412.1 alpha-soluble NSF attachment protein [Strigomonas culicis]
MAAKYYRTSGSKVTATEIVQKMADAKARSGDYAAAQQQFDQLARDALDDPLSRGNARKLFFSALLAQLAGMTPDTLMEAVGVLEETFNEYQELDVQFNVHTREHMLITALIDALQEENVEGFEEAVCEYDNICPLDATRQKMLTKAKATLRSRVNDLR